jgi:molybdopterin-containing oxidoreductase family membrane subunit
MTIFAVACAGIYPLVHTGRPWLDYWMLPYPSTLGMWPQFRSPLEWDVFAISTYATVSILFWFVGLLPDLATLRDRAENVWVKRFYGLLSLGWRFPPYFVAGAVYCGFAMVINLLIPIRRWYNLQNLITIKHFDVMGKVMLASGMIVTYGYFGEIFYAWYSGNIYEYFLIVNRTTGPYAWSYWALIICNVLIPQLLWSKRIRTNLPAIFIVSIFINIGMWFERWVIIVLSLHRDFLPASWGFYTPSNWDWGLYIGSFGWFFFLFFLFIRLLPMIATFEVRDLVHKLQGHGQKH